MPQQLSKHIRSKLEELLLSVGDMSLKRRARRIIEEITPQSGDKVIDLGSGTGYYLFLLNNLPVELRLTGFDNDAKALGEAKQFFADKRINFVIGDIHSMPFKDNSFNKAVCSEVLEHLKDDVQALKEIFRILRPGGTLVISVPSMNYPFLWDPLNWTLQRFFNSHIKTGFFSGIWSGHIRLYYLDDLLSKVKKVGFKVEKVEELTYWCLPFNHYLVNIIARLLYDIKIFSNIADSLSKFKQSRKPFLINIAFKFIYVIDKLNEFFPQNRGVNVFIKAKK